jgi:CRISPR-associated protein Cmr3
MTDIKFKHLIALEPLGLLYGASGRLLSPQALTGRASEHFPPDSPALAGLLASQRRDSVRDLYTAGPFWLDPDRGLMLPAPLTLLQERKKDGTRFSKRRLAWMEANGGSFPSGWRPADHQEPPRKAPSGGWIALKDWSLVGQESLIVIHDNPWLAVPHLHPKLNDDERISAGTDADALFLEYGIALRQGVSLAYLSSDKVDDGVYRFGGEGHLVQLRSASIPAELQALLSQKLTAPFTLITPGLWGGPKLSRREPIRTDVPGGVFPWHCNGQPPGILTEKARPWRHRLGAGRPRTDGKPQKPRLSRGRWAVPAGGCYQLAGEPLPPWAEWKENWFPKEGFSFKQLGTALALPIHAPPSG